MHGIVMILKVVNDAISNIVLGPGVCSFLTRLVCVELVTSNLSSYITLDIPVHVQD